MNPRKPYETVKKAAVYRLDAIPAGQPTNETHCCNL